MVAQFCEFTKIHWIATPKSETFMLCKLYFNKAVILKRTYLQYWVSGTGSEAIVILILFSNLYVF